MTAYSHNGRTRNGRVDTRNGRVGLVGLVGLPSHGCVVSAACRLEQRFLTRKRNLLLTWKAYFRCSDYRVSFVATASSASELLRPSIATFCRSQFLTGHAETRAPAFRSSHRPRRPYGLDAYCVSCEPRHLLDTTMGNFFADLLLYVPGKS